MAAQEVLDLLIYQSHVPLVVLSNCEFKFSVPEFDLSCILRIMYHDKIFLVYYDETRLGLSLCGTKSCFWDPQNDFTCICVKRHQVTLNFSTLRK